MAEQPAGERFGRYELLSQLGVGGMAETWRARLMGEAGVTKAVVIKRILPQYATDEQFVAMFINEARISTRLSHANIAQVFDFGREGEEYFLAMEYVEGQPLHRLLQRSARKGRRALPVPLATFIALEICRGLHYAHTRRDDQGQPLELVHRDVSLDNVLVSYEGEVKVVDFGIAKARALHDQRTEPGVIKGKYLYFSPEQARGQEVDARTDVWATGVILYALLCGRLPFEGPAHLVLTRLVKGQFPPPRQLRPHLPPRLVEILLKALEVSPERRFASSQEFAEALSQFLAMAAPRFSPASLGWLVQELFREDLEAQGRSVQVPTSFLRELAQPTDPLGAAALQELPAPPTTLSAPTLATAQQPLAVPPEPEPARISLRTLVAGAALLFAAGAAVMALRGRQQAPLLEALQEIPLPLPEETAAALPSEAPSEAGLEQPPGDSQAAGLLRRSMSGVARTYYEEGVRLFKQGEDAQAERLLEQCITAEPRYTPCYLMAGSVKARQGRHEEGASYYRRFLELEPHSRYAAVVKQLLEDYESRMAR